MIVRTMWAKPLMNTNQQGRDSSSPMTPTAMVNPFEVTALPEVSAAR